MITLYHTPLSPNSRRVWVALLEKGLSFDTVEVDLAGDQFKPEFLALNPFHHIPVVVDGETTVVESLAILDYLEAKYPAPALVPQAPAALATVKMVELLTINEVLPGLAPLIRRMMGGSADGEAVEAAIAKTCVALDFFEAKLQDSPYFGGDQLSLAEVVLGTIAPWFAQMGLPLEDYPRLQDWTARLQQRPAWQQTQPTPADFAALRARMQARRAQ